MAFQLSLGRGIRLYQSRFVEDSPLRLGRFGNFSMTQAIN